MNRENLSSSKVESGAEWECGIWVGRIEETDIW